MIMKDPIQKSVGRSVSQWLSCLLNAPIRPLLNQIEWNALNLRGKKNYIYRPYEAELRLQEVLKIGKFLKKKGKAESLRLQIRTLPQE